MPITHARDMVPPVRELIPQMHAELVSPPSREVYEERDGVLIRVGKTEPGAVWTLTPVLDKKGAPVLVESYDTLDEDGVTVRTHEGSLVQDEHCHDCGAGVKNGNKFDFHYLVCARINDRDHAIVRVPPYDVEVIRADGKPGRETREYIRLAHEEQGEPYPDSVLECGNASAKDIA